MDCTEGINKERKTLVNNRMALGQFFTLTSNVSVGSASLELPPSPETAPAGSPLSIPLEAGAAPTPDANVRDPDEPSLYVMEPEM